MNQILEINPYNCMARKGNKEQCSHKQKFGEYCGKHYNTNIIRIDQPLELKQKKKNILVIPQIVNNLPVYTTMKEIYLRNITKIIKIQSFIRGSIIRYLNKLRGPGLFKRTLCNNDCDIYLMDDIKTIHLLDFYSVKEHDNFIYGFHIETIYKYINLNSDKTEINNPYTNRPLPNGSIQNINIIYNYYKKIGFRQPIVNIVPQDTAFLIKNKVLTIFQKMDQLNNYTDIDWFLCLDHSQLIKLVFLVKDLFEYRLDLTQQKKENIMSIGYVFPKECKYYKNLAINELKTEILDEFDKLVSQGKSKDDKYLGSLIILSGIVELVPKCALAYPWLVQGTFMNN
jgi:hypothetical protein